jgi:hypothetical protein
MPQLFPAKMNVLARISLFGVPFLLAGLLWGGLIFTRSSFGTGIKQSIVQQPIPFSHQHHAGLQGIDCRYCHTSVENSPFAGIPPTKTCMNCHSQIWVGSPMLEPVRESYKTGNSLRWRRIYNLPGFVYFDHSIHVQKGVGCSTCHGRVDQMPFMYQQPTLLMEWCLECHRNPAEQVRPREEVFNMKYQQPDGQTELGRKLVKRYKIKDPASLTSCTTCHR